MTPLDVAIGGLAALGVVAGLFVASRREASALAAWTTAAAALALSGLVLVLRGPWTVVALALLVAASQLASRDTRWLAIALGAVALATWADPVLGVGGAAMLAWTIPESRPHALAWAGLAVALCTLPTAWMGTPIPARIAVLGATALLAYAGRRTLASSVPSPALRGAAYFLTALVPALALVLFAALQGRVESLADLDMWRALLVAVLPVGAGAGALVLVVGGIAIAGTSSGLKPLAAGALLSSFLGSILLTGRGAFLLILPLALAFGVGIHVLRAAARARFARRRPHAPMSPERRLI